MAPKRQLKDKSEPEKKKGTRKTITVEQKVDVIRRYERGESTAAIKLALGLPESTLRTIRKDKDKIMAAFKAGTGGSSSRVSSGQSTFMVRLEKMIVTWMDHRKRQGLSVTTDDAQKKAMEVYEHLKAKEDGPVPQFTASRGWFHRFKARHAFRSIRRSGEAKSADADAAAAFPDELRALIEEGGYLPQQVFNMDETGLQWKKMPERTYITKEEKSAPGFKAYKDRFTLLLGANLTGDCKLKPVLVYHAENPRALKGYDKATLPVYWYSNATGWMTGGIFQSYVKNQLVGELREYCLRQGIPFKILMLLDNAPAHPQTLLELHEDVSFVYLPPNTTSLIQPMDQGVIRMFKTHFLQKAWRSLSRKCDVSLEELEKAAEAPEDPVELQKDVVRRHWKEYTIRDALWHVRDAWREVTVNCIRGAWKKLCPDLAVDFGGFDIAEGLSRERLKCLEVAKKVGLDMEEDDVDSLLESIGEELTTEDLEDLEQQRHRLEEEVEAGQQEETPQRREMTIPLLQKFLGMLNDALNVMEEIDPDCQRSGLKRRRIMEEVKFYEDLLQKKRRSAMQTTLDRFFKTSSTPASTSIDEPQPGTSTGGLTIPPSPSPPLETPPRLPSSSPSPPLPAFQPRSSSPSDVDDPAPL